MASRTDDLVYSVTWNHADRTDLLRETGWKVQERAAVTEFYEFYWAPRYRTTTLSHVTGWLIPLVLRPLGTFSTPRLRGPRGVVRWLPVVVLAVALLAMAGLATVDAPAWVSVIVLTIGVLAAMIIGTFLGLVAAVKVIALCILAGVVGSVLVWGVESISSVVGAAATSAVALAIGTWIASRITRSLGDAARYLGSDNPDNVEESEVIRTRVLQLLEDLRDARDPDTGRPRYDRVVLVGHSLGSVIAYDAVRLLWSRSYRELVLPAKAATDTASCGVRKVESIGVRLRSRSAGDQLEPGPMASAAEPMGENRDEPPSVSVDEWFAAQRSAGLVVADAQNTNGSKRWIVSDLITLGSPLTYADAFMASSEADLADRFTERSLAADPPLPQVVRRAAGHPFRLWIPGPGGGSTRWHHAAPFATVRWTNAWFEHDIVGGPVGPHFGPGIRDVSLGGTKWMAGMAFAYPHSSYWVASRHSLVRAGSEVSRAILRHAIQRRADAPPNRPLPPRRQRHH